MARLLVLVLASVLVGCEPCAIVMGGHCQDREQNRDEDVGTEKGAPDAYQPAPVPWVPQVRGSRG